MDAKQITELRASKIFIRSLKPDCEDKYFEFQDERGNTDIVYKPNNYKLQITSVDGGPNKLARHGRYEYGIKIDKLIDEYIIKPINNKFDLYRGHGVSDVILLIHTLNKPFRGNLLNKEIDSNRIRIKAAAEKSGFKSIYLVIDNQEEVILIY